MLQPFDKLRAGKIKKVFTEVGGKGPEFVEG
jgi:hypothetical protein